MKFLIFFAVAALYGSVHCDKECFRPVFKECVRDAVPMERMTLCDELLFTIGCIADKALDCDMEFMFDAVSLTAGVTTACIKRNQIFLKDHKACFAKSLNATRCVEPINEVMKDVKTQEDSIKANKKICNLIDTYEDCALEEVDKNCHNERARDYFDYIYKPLRRVNKGICEELVLPADEKDSRPDNFGVINVFTTFLELFA